MRLPVVVSSRALLLLGVALALPGCVDAPAPAARPLASLSGGIGALDALGRRFGRLRERMRQRGRVLEAGPARLFILEGEGVEVPIDLPTDHCTTFVAVSGSSVVDLRITLYDADGDEVARDDEHAEGGLVHVCPPLPVAVPRSGALPTETATAAYHLVFESREGSGALVAAGFGSERGGTEGFAGLFAGLLSPRVPMREVEEHLARTRAAMRARGLLPVGPPVLATVAEGEEVRRTFVLEADRCYAVTARGAEGLSDVDVFVYDPAGAEVARDLGGDAEPSLELCTTEGGPYSVQARAFEGAGALGLMVLQGAPGARPLMNAAALAEEPPAVDAVAQRDPGVMLAIVANALGARGYEPPLFVAQSADIAPGESRAHEVLVGPGCAVLAGAASGESTDIDIYLTDATGHEIARDTGVQPTARVDACSRTPRPMRVTIKAYGRGGTYSLALMRAPTLLADLVALRLEEATSRVRASGYRDLWVVESALEQGESESREVTIASGRCLAIAVAGDANVGDVDLFLRDATGRLVASESGPDPYAAVRRCATSAERLRVEALVYRGSGVVKIAALEGAP